MRSIYFVFSLVSTFLFITFAVANTQVTAPQSNPSITLTYCVDPDWMPYEAIRAGQHVGLSADYMRLIGQRANIEFQLIATQTWNETLSNLKNGKCDVASMLNRSPERESYLAFSLPYFNAENVFVTNSNIPFIAGYDSIQNKRLGLVRNYRHQEYVQRYYPQLNVTLVDNEVEGLFALAAGDIDVMVGSMLSIATHIQKFGLNDLKVSGLAKPHDQLSMGVIKKHIDILERINQAINKIDETEQVELFRRWNQVTIIDQVDYRVFYGLAAVVLIITSLFIWRNYYIVKFNKALLSKNTLLESLQLELLEKNKQLEFLSNRDALTSLYNRHYMIHRCEQEISGLKRSALDACLVLYDIDHFKMINDTYGHSLGDTILCQLTELVAEHIRDIDVMARWGGEEFLILCPQSNIAAATTLAERIQNAVADFSFATIGNLTCSFGIAQYQNKESFIEWFDRADNAMYQAKEQGRNKIVTTKN
jgi:diguanylate cyclase (GGDEF)-like protein